MKAVSWEGVFCSQRSNHQFGWVNFFLYVFLIVFLEMLCLVLQKNLPEAISLLLKTNSKTGDLFWKQHCKLRYSNSVIVAKKQCESLKENIKSGRVSGRNYTAEERSPLQTVIEFCLFIHVRYTNNKNNRSVFGRSLILKLWRNKKLESTLHS